MHKPHPVDVEALQAAGAAADGAAGGFIWGVRSSFQCVAGFLMVIVIAVIYSTGEHWKLTTLIEDRPTNTALGNGHLEFHRNYTPMARRTSQCDLFSGKWVFDDESMPLYSGKQCPFAVDETACEQYERKNLSYQHWRWQPHHCDIPRFNATALLEMLRNKRLVFVGDSLIRGQWMSMLCLLETALPSSPKSLHYHGSSRIFKAIEYNATIESYWEPLLVESNADDLTKHRIAEANRTVRINGIEKHARYWTDADFLVFNSYLWWREPTIKAMWGSFENPADCIYKAMETLRAYELALQTWSNWLEIHVNRSKTRMFWVSMSPTHERSEEWGAIEGVKCYYETEPIFKEGYQGNGSYPNMMRVVEDAIERLNARGLKVQFLNITQLSEYRKDAHPSIYRRQWETLTQEQLANPISYADCTHWCLPGVPDTWNQLLYAYMISNVSHLHILSK
ncbi:hypothetical protein Ancab_015222 [Ancistrocladus abbreviatus]